MTYFSSHQDFSIDQAHEVSALIIDAHMQILAMNAKARALLQNGARIHVRFGRLDFSRHSDKEKVNQALKMLKGHDNSHTRVLFDDPDHPMSLSCSSLLGGAGGGTILVLIQEASQQSAPQISHITDTYGLTPTETRLLKFLCSGCNVPQAAAQLRVAYSTARSHLQHVFDKTGVRRQADLMRLIGTLANGH